MYLNGFVCVCVENLNYVNYSVKNSNNVNNISQDGCLPLTPQFTSYTISLAVDWTNHKCYTI